METNIESPGNALGDINFRLTDDRLPVAPGGKATTSLLVRNQTSVVLECRIHSPADEPTADWVRFRSVRPKPGQIDKSTTVSFLNNGQEAEIEVTIHVPPQTSVPAGPTSITILVDSVDTGEKTAEVECIVVVAEKPAIRSSLPKRSARGRLGGQLLPVEVTNTGNVPVAVGLNLDYDHAVLTATSLLPQGTIEPGQSIELGVEIRPTSRKLLSPPVTHSLTITSQMIVGEGTPQTGQIHHASFEHRPLIPGTVAAIVAPLIAAAIYLGWPNPSPPPPGELSAVVDIDEVRLRWDLPDDVATTQVALVECENDNATEPPTILRQIEVPVASAGEIPLDDATDGPLCVAARSIGRSGAVSPWSEQSGPLGRTPTSLEASSEELRFEAAEGAAYEVLVDGQSVGEFTESPIQLSDLEMSPGAHDVQLRAITSGSISVLTPPLTVSASFALVGANELCLDARPEAVLAWTCEETDSQRWLLSADSELVGVGGRCLDVQDASDSNGTRVQMRACSDVPQQVWEFGADNQLIGLGGKCLDISGPEQKPGSSVQIWECLPVDNQRWEPVQ